jgi:hypothetical protein
MNGCEGIFRVNVDVYPKSCSKLECPCEGDKFRLLCRSPTGSGQTSMSESRVTTAYPAGCAMLNKAATIREIFNVQIANRLIC